MCSIALVDASLISMEVLGKEECYVEEEVATVVRTSVTVAGFQVDAALFTASLPAPEDVEVTSFSGMWRHFP